MLGEEVATLPVRTAPASRRSRSARIRGGVAAIVLAAGVSSRMGKAKALVPLAGRPLLVHVLEALRPTDIAAIVVVLGAEAGHVRGEIPLDGTRVVVNPNYAEGMSSSIQIGVRTAAWAEAFLIVLGDQPLISSATVDALLARREATKGRLLVPTYSGVRGNPVLLDRSLRSEVDSIAGDVGCRGIVQAHADEAIEVPVDDPGILLDVDTPEEVLQAEAALARPGGLGELVASRLHGAALRKAA